MLLPLYVNSPCHKMAHYREVHGLLFSEAIWGWCHAGGGDERKEIIEVKNGKHLTYHSEWHNTADRVLHALSQKDITLWTVTGCFCNKGWVNCCISKRLSDGTDIDMSTVSQHSHIEKSTEQDEVQTWKINMLSKKNQQRAQVGSCPPASVLWASQIQDTIQIYINMKTFVTRSE